MFLRKSKYFSKTLLIFIFVYSLLLYAETIWLIAISLCAPASIAWNMRSEAFSIVPHFHQAILINELKVCLFLSYKSRRTHNALKSDFEARLTYNVIEYEKVKAVFL